LPAIATAAASTSARLMGREGVAGFVLIRGW
jgi:hypothetical protein